MKHPDHNRLSALEGAGLKAFFRITEAWRVTDNEQGLLLGSRSRPAFESLKKGSPEPLSGDALDRLSYILGIHKALTILFSTENQERWLKSANQDAPFHGKSPLDHMLTGRIEALREVRQYLDGARG